MKTKYILTGWVIDDNHNRVGAILDVGEAVNTEWCISESGWEIINSERVNELLEEDELLFYHKADVNGSTRYCSQEDVDYCQQKFGWNKKKTVKAYGKYLRLHFDVKQRYLENIPDHRNIVFPMICKIRFSEKCYVGFWHVDPQSVEKDLLSYEDYDYDIFHLAGTCTIVEYTKPGDFTSYFETDCDFVEWRGRDVPEPLKTQWLRSNKKGDIT